MDLKTLKKLKIPKYGKKTCKKNFLAKHNESLNSNILESIKKTQIDCVLSSNLDINAISRDIVSIIKNQDKIRIQCLEKEINKYSTMLNNPQQILTRFLRKMYEIELKTREEEIERILSNANVKEFKTKTSELVRKHKSLDRVDDEALRKLIVGSFLDISSNYCNITIKYDYSKSKEIKCNECDNPDIDITDNGTYLCPECHNEWSIIVKYGSVSVEDETNKSSGMYETRKNFEKSLKKFEGIHSNIDDKDTLFAKLDKYFYKTLSKTRLEMIEMVENDKKQGRTKLSKQKMLNALSAINHSEYYRDVNVIMSEYWHWSCRDLDDYRDTILESYDKYVKEFKRMYKDKPLPTNDFFLYLLLNKAKLERGEQMVDKSEFKIIKTQSILNGHINRTARICKILSRTDPRWDFFDKINW